MKKSLFILCTVLLLALLAACGTTNNTPVSEPASTTFPAEEIIPKETEVQETTPTSSTHEFDFETGTVILNNGVIMPILGIGTFSLSDSEAEESVYWALRDGYRLIDTARIYGDEAGVGRGIRRAIDEGFVTREEIFVTTKMWTSDYDNGDAAINASLERLGLDYVDLMILHHSQPENDVAAYKAMEQAVVDGRLKSIGLSNYYDPDDFDRVVNATTILPAVLQNETHPYHQSTDMKEHIAQYGTVLESWFPLGGTWQHADTVQRSDHYCNRIRSWENFGAGHFEMAFAGWTYCNSRLS